MSDDDEYIRAAVRRRVGKAVLARLRRLAAEQARRDQAEAVWARRLIWSVIACAALFLVWLARQ